MEQDNKMTVSRQAIAIYTLMTTAIFDLLAEKGILSVEQVTERMKKLKSDLNEEIALRHNMLMTEAVFELLTEKGILTGEEVMERVKKIKAETPRQPRWVQ